MAEIDTVMRALADPTRRGLFERLASTEEITVGELTRESGVTQGAVSQHLKTLRHAGLVAERPEGRNTYYRTQREGLEPMIEWMTRYGVFWSDRLAVLDRLLRDDDARKASPPNGDKKRPNSCRSIPMAR